MPVPHVAAAERLEINDLVYKDDRVIHVTARIGYMDEPNVPGLLPLIREADLESPLDDGKLSYFRSRIELHLGNTPGSEPLAQTPVPRDSTVVRRRHRILPAPSRTHRYHGLTH